MRKIIVIFAVLLLSLPLVAIVSACEAPINPAIVLSPPQGFAMTMITGTGFHAYTTITITYDGAAQPTIPTSVKSDNKGAFNSIVAIPDELAVGAHTITANDGLGSTASATFTVVDMKGQQGIQGVAGANGLNGLNGVDFNATGNIIVNNGTNGLNGLNGLPGANGLNGQDFNATGNVLVFNGTDGTNGTNGLNGTNGINGVNGANGTNGKNGATGAQGATGSEGTTGTLEKIVYVDPSQTSGMDSLFIAILVAALIALTATITIVYRKTK